MVSFDMGGTSSDIALGEDGRVLEQTSVLIGDWEIAAPMLMINTIGAGGGTIAWIDGGGALQVGPHSAGAEPGPVAYDKGGTQPTVTDADLILGMLHPEYLLGGKVKTNKQKAYEAIADMGAQLGIDPMGTAEGIIRIINAKMEEGIREVSTERGYDLRNFVLVAFGGRGACPRGAARRRPRHEQGRCPSHARRQFGPRAHHGRPEARLRAFTAAGPRRHRRFGTERSFHGTPAASAQPSS